MLSLEGDPRPSSGALDAVEGSKQASFQPLGPRVSIYGSGIEIVSAGAGLCVLGPLYNGDIVLVNLRQLPCSVPFAYN